jgi:hypothetical protein
LRTALPPQLTRDKPVSVCLSRGRPGSLFVLVPGVMLCASSFLVPRQHCRVEKPPVPARTNIDVLGCGGPRADKVTKLRLPSVVAALLSSNTRLPFGWLVSRRLVPSNPRRQNVQTLSLVGVGEDAGGGYFRQRSPIYGCLDSRLHTTFLRATQY